LYAYRLQRDGLAGKILGDRLVIAEVLAVPAAEEDAEGMARVILTDRVKENALVS
jgi:hypothetical protein